MLTPMQLLAVAIVGLCLLMTALGWFFGTHTTVRLPVVLALSGLLSVWCALILVSLAGV